MFDGIPAAQIGDRPVIEVPRPKAVLDHNGKLVFRDQKPQFDVKADSIDYMMSKQSPVRVAFSEQFIINSERRATPTELAVLFYLANTTEWSDVEILVDGENKPLLTQAGQSQAVISRYGNRSATRTIDEIAQAVGVSYGAAHKALRAWEDAKVMWRIKEYGRNVTEANERRKGRTDERRRYEFDPQYVWNGHIWIGNGYADFLLGRIEVVG